MNTVTIPSEPQSLPTVDPARRQTVIGAVGNTPLIELRSLTRDIPGAGVKLLAKCEWFNPGGSVKDRPALNMLLDGERRGLLRPGKTILDATSGNTGIAYAMFGAAMGYKVKLALPVSAGALHKRILAFYGAELIYTPATKSSDGAIEEAVRLYQESPELYFYPDQYNNDANWQAHYHGTALEIWNQTQGRITHFVAGLGTSGTFTGNTRRLRELNPEIRCYSVQPDSPMHGLEGWKHMATSLKPGFYDEGLADESREVATEDAQDMIKRLAREEGLLVSPSAAAAVTAALQVAREIREGVVVTVLADNASKYLDHYDW